MKNINRIPYFRFTAVATALLLFSVHYSVLAADLHYKQTNLVADQLGIATKTDANLQNAWGIAFNQNGPVWIANNHSGSSTLYDGNGVAVAGLPVVNVPGADGNPGDPTGIVFNASKDFNVTANNPAIFIFANEGGSLAAWNPTVDLNNAMAVGEPIIGETPIYKGLALAANGKEHFLYATDFHNNKVRVFNNTFKLVDAKITLGCDFSDPNIPVGFAPFGIQNINGVLYVTYAQQDANKEDDLHGPGLGYVNIFDANGCLIRRFASAGALNAPWGVALAPANFGVHSDQVLISNFGDGMIGAYSLDGGHFNGLLRDAKNKKIKIDGLWALAFGNGLLDQRTNSLFFTAGPNGETNGLYGKIEVTK